MLRNGVVAILFAVMMLGQFALGVVGRAGGAVVCVDRWACLAEASCGAAPEARVDDCCGERAAVSVASCDGTVGSIQCVCCVRLGAFEAPSPASVRSADDGRVLFTLAPPRGGLGICVAGSASIERRPPRDDRHEARRRPIESVRLLI